MVESCFGHGGYAADFASQGRARQCWNWVNDEVHNPGTDWKNGLQILGAGRKSLKLATLVVARKPNGKSPMKNGTARQGAFGPGKTNHDIFLEFRKNHRE
jgi:hypothetical protein